MLKSLISRFRKDHKGNTALFFALCLVPICMFVGGAVDYSSFVSQRHQVQDALDEAALMAAITPAATSDASQQIANNTFATNINRSNINASITGFKIADNGQSYDLTAQGAYHPFMLQMFGMTELGYSVESKTLRASDGTLELALVLDNTWSMSQALDGSQTKIQVLKTAAQNLVSTILTPASKDYVKISVVPYADYVNVGTANRSASWLSVPADSSVVNPGTCKTISTKTTCTGGTIGTCTGNQDGVPYTYSCWIVAQTCTTVNITPYQSCSADTTTNYKWYGCVRNQMKSNALVLPDPTTPYTGISQTSQTCLNPILPLNNDATTVSSTINNLVVNIGSYKPETYIPGGLVWGTNVLSPPAPFQEGVAYDPANAQPRKVIVLMTDGANTLYSNSSGAVAVANATQLAATYADQKRVCDYAKSKKIEIYTIGFGVTDATALASLKDCASDGAHYFDAKSSADLIGAFKTITGKLTHVRIAR